MAENPIILYSLKSSGHSMRTEKAAPQKRDGRANQFAYYSFTPPRATPAMMYLLSAKYTIISGSAVRVRPR